jgi:hypothetical protein
MDRHVQTIWCDDIRQELGNKLSFMGVYTGGLVVPGKPIVLSRLCVWIAIHSDIKNPIRTAKVQVTESDGTVLFDMPPGEIPLSPPDSKKTMHSIMVAAQISPFPISEKCEYFEVVVHADGEVLKGRKLWVHIPTPDQPIATQ